MRREEFEGCFSRGRRYLTKRFVIFVLDRGDGDPRARLGTAISKKIGSAVRRNRIRRLLKEFFRLHRGDLVQGVDLVVTPKRGIDPDGLGFDTVAAEFSAFFAKLRAESRRRAPATPPENGSEFSP